MYLLTLKNTGYSLSPLGRHFPTWQITAGRFVFLDKYIYEFGEWSRYQYDVISPFRIRQLRVSERPDLVVGIKFVVKFPHAMKNEQVGWQLVLW